MKKNLFLSLFATILSFVSFADTFKLTLPSGAVYTSGSVYVYCPEPARGQFEADITSFPFFATNIKFELFRDNTLLYTETLQRNGAANVTFTKDWVLIPGVYKIRVTKGSQPASDVGAVSVDEVPNYLGFLNSTVWSSQFTNNNNGYNEMGGHLRTLADVDGDGDDDVVAFGNSDVKVGLSNGSTGFGSQVTWSTGWSNAQGWGSADYTRCLADVDNDGDADIIGFGSAGTYVSLSNGSSFGSSSLWSTGFGANNGWNNSNGLYRTAADVNNDGRADLIGFSNSGVSVQLSTGTGFGATQNWSTGWGPNNGWGLNGTIRMMADVNGDNRADIVGYGSNGVYVALSNGTSFPSSSLWTTAFAVNDGWNNSDYVRTVGKVDGATADLVVFGYDGVYVAKSNGTNAFQTAQRYTSLFSSLHGFGPTYSRKVGDINGDGWDDIVGFGGTAVTASLSDGYYYCEPWVKSGLYNDKVAYANFGGEESSLSISEETVASELSKISFYPNPSNKDISFFGMDLDENYEVSIVDMRGVQVVNAKVSSLNSSISIDQLEAGNYIVSIKSNGVSTIQKLVKY